jgi:YVTN family beta-propeller protein
MTRIFEGRVFPTRGIPQGLGGWLRWGPLSGEALLEVADHTGVQPAAAARTDCGVDGPVRGLRRTVLLVACVVLPACAQPAPTPTTQAVPSPAPGGTAGAPARPPSLVLRADLANLLWKAYVPNSLSDTVTVVDVRSRRVLTTFRVGHAPQHVVPSYDLQTLWVNNNGGNSLTPIDPHTGRPGKAVPVDDPYNLYFTPDGRLAVVVAERLRRLDFRDPHTFRKVHSLSLPCVGPNHLDFSEDGSFFLVSCEFDGRLVKVDTASRRVVGVLQLGDMPQDVRLAPDRRRFLVADMMRDGLHVVDGQALRRVAFVSTGVGAHGVYPSRDGSRVYVTNRGWHTVTGGRRGPGSVAVLDGRTLRVVLRWSVPGGGSPDMGNFTPDGRELWLAGRYDDEVYAFDTTTGTVVARIPVGRGPHGLTVWPQPGRYSLGHTGNMR